MLDGQQRRQLLGAMGIDVYLLRGATAAPSHAVAGPAGVANDGAIGIVVACSAAALSEPRMARLRTLLPLALGVDAARVAWLAADAKGELPEVPSVPAYLALGSDMPRALGAHLSTMQQMSATIAAADAPTASLRDGLAKRALWQALKPLARRVNGSASNRKR